MSKSKTGKYNWKFITVGGVTRVNIENGNDIAHLGELDQKLWTALSCPVAGLEFDGTTLAYLDTNNDGRIHVNEVVSASKWLTAILKDSNALLAGEDFISTEAVNESTDEGKAILAGIANINKVNGTELDTVNLADAAAALAKLAEAAAEAKAAGEEVLPYGEDTEDALALAGKLKTKIDDFFLRSRLAAFDAESTAALDVSAERIGAISAKELPGCIDEIATYPLARISGAQELALDAAINPAWAADFAKLKTIVIDKDFPGAKAFTDADWQAVQGKLATYSAWKEAAKKEADEFLGSQKAEAETIKTVDKFLHLHRDFYKFLRNFVTCSDFYGQKENDLAIFQAGKLFIDQRCLDLCIKVVDMGKHGDMAAKSGMFILYCHCVSTVKGAAMDIAAVVTAGDIRSLHVGQNASFYDGEGHDWDATVTSIVDNPVSVGQAFWSPYRKFAKWCTDKINKSAEEKESKAFGDLTAKAESTSIPTDAAAAGAAAEKKQAFDIAKFAGIFAAIGMAVGFILDAVVGLLDSIIKMPWWGIFVLIAAIVLLISGPSMFIAWTKLRKRNLAPVLNANGWAINSRILVNTVFGATLTHIAKYPKSAGKDPFKPKTPLCAKITYWVLALAAAGFIASCIYCKGLPWKKCAEPVEEPVAEEVVEAVPEVAEEVPAEAPAEVPAV